MMNRTPQKMSLVPQKFNGGLDIIQLIFMDELTREMRFLREGIRGNESVIVRKDVTEDQFAVAKPVPSFPLLSPFPVFPDMSVTLPSATPSIAVSRPLSEPKAVITPTMRMPTMRMTLPFSGSVVAYSEKTLATERLDFAFTIRSLTVHPTPNSRRTVDVKLFISTDSIIPESGEPDGINAILSQAQSDCIRYHNIPKTVFCNRYCPPGRYLKLYCKDSGGYDRTIDVLVEIDAEIETFK